MHPEIGRGADQRAGYVMKKSILFVDDEQSVLSGLQRSLRGQRKEWDMEFRSSGKEALEAVAENSFDAVVTDMRMPGMDGAQLLEKIAKSHPEIIRIILSGHSDEEMIVRSAGVAHQFITKPCEATALKETLDRAFALYGFLGDSKLVSLITGLQRLPSIPTAYQQITEKLQSENASLWEIGEVVSNDPAMTAKILQLVNSAFFGLGRRVSDTKEAASLIGLDALKALVLSIGVFSQFEEKSIKDNAFSIESLLHHSLAVANLAERIAKSEGVEKSVSDDCFLAGMLHDIGILILEQNLSEEYAKVRSLVTEQGMDLSDAETEVFGTTHGAVGAYLLGLWALPNPVVEAVAFHHQPGLLNCDSFCPLGVVHVANILLRQAKASGKASLFEAKNMDREFLEKAGMIDRLDAWKELLLSVEDEA
jgi:putative nucleotidyltransferase with HDIG domain